MIDASSASSLEHTFDETAYCLSADYCIVHACLLKLWVIPLPKGPLILTLHQFRRILCASSCGEHLLAHCS